MPQGPPIATCPWCSLHTHCKCCLCGLHPSTLGTDGDCHDYSSDQADQHHQRDSCYLWTSKYRARPTLRKGTLIGEHEPSTNGANNWEGAPGCHVSSRDNHVL